MGISFSIIQVGMVWCSGWELASVESMLGAMAFGADGVQVGNSFVVSDESSAHPNFNKRIINSNEGETSLLLKQLTPVRLIKSNFMKKSVMLNWAGHLLRY